MIELVLLPWRDWSVSFDRPDDWLPVPGTVLWVLRFGPILMRCYRKA